MTEPRLLKYRHSPPWDLSAYVKDGGYQALKTCVTTLTRNEVIAQVKQSGLRGRGGAAFPTWVKFDKVLNHETTEHHFVCNAGEHEPGTFKDRHLLRTNPHQIIEGCAIAAYTVNATTASVYINSDYVEEIGIFRKALALARDGRYLGSTVFGSATDLDIEVFVGEGSYVAGEETAMLESMQGRPAMPRQKPPFYPTEFGLHGKPTLVSNVETLSNLPHIIQRGATWFSSVGTAKSPGTMLFSLSGAVNRPGVYELPLGTPLKTLIDECGEGIPGEHGIKAVFPGGPSFAMLPGTQLDVPLDADALKQAGSGLGSAGVIVVDDQTCIIDTMLYFMRFFKRESCGQCPPCRLGTINLESVVHNIHLGNGTEHDIDTLIELCSFAKGQGYCTLVTGATVLVESSIRHFRHEYETHIHRATCALLPYTPATPYSVEILDPAQ
jgi:NADH-quinone oxidoreductase subunit F